jgi:WD40 repeat protein
MILIIHAFDYVAHLFDVSTGKEIKRFTGYSNDVNSAALSPDGKTIITDNWDKETGYRVIYLWNITSGRAVNRINKHRGKTLLEEDGYPNSRTFHPSFSPDSKNILTTGTNETLIIEEIYTEKTKEFIDNANYPTSSVFSPNGKMVLTTSGGEEVRLWDVSTGKEIKRFTGHPEGSNSAVFSPDGKMVLTTSRGGEVHLFDVSTGKEIKRFTGHSEGSNSAVFSPDGKMILTASNDRTVRLWDVSTGKEIRRLSRYSREISGEGFNVLTPFLIYAIFSPDGQIILTIGHNEAICLWNVSTGKEIKRFTMPRESSYISSAVFSPDGKMILTASDDNQTRFWDANIGRELCSLISFKDGSWAVTTPEGRYDASDPDRIEGLHWVLGLEPIALNQFKKFYYEPGLLARIMAGKPAPFNVPDFSKGNIKLYPEVAVTPPKPGDKTLAIHLTNQGGGLGRTTIWVDGNLLTDDARPKGFNPNQSKATLTVSLAKVPALKPGQERQIRVVAENQTGDVQIQSRGSIVSYVPDQSTAITAPPELFAIVLGTSDYALSRLHLRYASKDARDFASATTAGAKKLFGVDKVHLYLLTSDDKDPKKQTTRANIVATFEEVRKRAKSTDILVVYGAGHGISVHRPDRRDDLYCYLTQEAHTDVAQDYLSTALCKTSAITSDDLAEWLNVEKGIKASKKVIILDTCAAGAAQEALSATVRELTPEEVARARAIDQLKDRTAFHVLMGCASNRSSYEAGEYGQGLLTYALLETMKSTERFVEVPGIFKQVEERVAQLAAGIGGVQKPQIASPQGSTIQIGEMGQEEKKVIHLANRRLRLLAPVFQNPEEVGDPLELTDRVTLLLSNESNQSIESRGGFLFVGKGKLPGAIEPSGSYTVLNGQAQVRIVLRRDGKVVKGWTETFSIKSIDALAKHIAQAIQTACTTISP